VGALQTAQLLIRPERVLRGKVPTSIAWAAGLGLRASSAVRDLVGGRRPADVRELTRFGPEHDCVWEQMARGVTCAVVRDALVPELEVRRSAGAAQRLSCGSRSGVTAW
jgi:hypothetical protein